MNFQSEADICGELLKIAKTGQLYRGSKPIMWSPVEQTALAEAEVEYKDRKATQIYVKGRVLLFGQQRLGQFLLTALSAFLIKSIMAFTRSLRWKRVNLNRGQSQAIN